jgi:AcrR family transcriptional regulator
MAAQADQPTVPSDPSWVRSRRRGEQLRSAIYDAVLEQLQRVGYLGLTMEGVATCARTGKAALYRRWPCKEDLVVDALDDALPSFNDLPDHGSVRDDLLDLLRQMAAFVNSPTGAALETVMAEVDPDSPFGCLLRERIKEPRKRMLLTVLRRGVERGEIRPGAVNPLVAQVGPAMVLQRFLADRGPVPDAYIVSVVDDVIVPLLRP